MLGRLTLVLPVLLAASGFASAQLDPIPDCGDMRFSLPAPFAAWFNPRQDATRLIVNEPALVVLDELSDDESVGRSAWLYGGDIPFTIEREGRYEIAVGRRADIDVVRNGNVVRPRGRRSGPACSDVHRVHSYRLTRGEYALRVRANGNRRLILIYQ